MTAYTAEDQAQAPLGSLPLAGTDLKGHHLSHQRQ
jgi:hypothetical protein